MGYYIETPEGPKDKATNIHKRWGGRMVYSPPPSFKELEYSDEVLIVVCDNGPFEAAAICHSESEHKEFTGNPDDCRPKRYLVLPKVTALEAFAAGAGEFAWDSDQAADMVKRLRQDLGKSPVSTE